MKRFKNILMYAGTEENSAAISRAVELAMENDANLTLIDVIKPIPQAIGMMTNVAAPKELEKLVVQEHREKLLQLAADYSDTGVNLNAVVRVGKAPIEIVREVLQGKHDLVIKTADGCSLLNRLFGTTSQSLMRMCPCPVWVLKPNVHGPFDRVLVAIDMDTQDSQHDTMNRVLLDLANSIARRDSAALHVVSVWDIWMEQSLRRRAGETEVDALLETRAAQVDAEVHRLLQEQLVDISQVKLHLHHGTPAKVITDVANEMEADLLVMGTVCRTGVAGFLIGNTAEYVLANATCSLLTLKPEGFITPVTLVDQEVDEDKPWPADLRLV